MNRNRNQNQVWVISRTPVKEPNGNEVVFGYVKSEKEAEQTLAYYRRYASMHSIFKAQKLDLIVKGNKK